MDATVPSPRGARAALPFVAFLLSGAAGLVYEVCWIRRAALVFGSTTQALSSVLAVFFLGLALGSEWFGRASARVRTPLRLYALLEALLALAALASLPLFGAAEAGYGAAYRAFAGQGVLLALARLALVAVVLLPPTVLMGATLPLMARQFVRERERIARSVALLYALNTLGAAAGCLLAGLWLLPALGGARAIAVGAALSAAAALLAFATRAEPLAPATAEPGAAMGGAHGAAGAGLVQALLFAAGFTGLAFEVLWARFLGLVVHNTVYTYTLTLAAVLFGIVAGSALAATVLDRVRARAALWATLQLAGAVLVPALLLAPPALWRGMGSELAVILWLMVPSSVLAGAAFPLGVRLVVGDPRFAGVGVGRATALNTCGGIAGSLAAGFLLLPRAGLQASLLVVSGVGLAAGLAALLVLAESPRRAARVVLALAAVALWFAVPRVLGTRLPVDYLATPGAVLVDHREGMVSNVAVNRRDGVLELEIDHWWQGQSTRTHQIMAAHLPMMLHPSARRVMVVGLGVGQTADRFLMHGVERLDVVDIEPALFDIVPRRFHTAWTKDPRVRLLPEDGRNVIAHTGERYDVLSIEVGLAFRPGVPAFYTADFYRRARARLAPGGLLSQFVPFLGLPPEVVPGMLASFREVFPHAVLWYNTSEALLVGVNADSLVVSADSLARALAHPRVRTDLATFRYWGGPGYALDQPAVFLSGFLCGERGLAALAGNAASYRDDRPALDYATTRVLARNDFDLGVLDSLRAHLDDPATVVRPLPPADTLARAAALRATNLGHMEAGALVNSIRRRGLAWTDAATFDLAARALRACPENGDAVRLYAQALVRRGQGREAEAWFARALALAPDDALAARDLGWLLLDQGRVADAEARLAAAVAARPWDADAHNGLGAALATRGDLAGARREFARALALDPANAEIRDNLARAGGAPPGTRR